MGTGSSLGEAGWQGAGFGRNASIIIEAEEEEAALGRAKALLFERV